MKILDEMRCSICGRKLSRAKALFETAWSGVYWCGSEPCAFELLTNECEELDAMESKNIKHYSDRCFILRLSKDIHESDVFDKAGHIFFNVSLESDCTCVMAEANYNTIKEAQAMYDSLKSSLIRLSD